MNELLNHTIVVTLFVIVAYVLLIGNTRNADQKTITMICEAQYQSLRKQIHFCPAEFELKEIEGQIDAWYDHFNGRVHDERLDLMYQRLIEKLQERKLELIAPYA